MTHTIRPLYGLYPNYGTPVQVVVDERTGLDFFFSVVCRQAGWTCTHTSQVRPSRDPYCALDGFILYSFICFDMKRSVVLISIVRVPTYEY